MDKDFKEVNFAVTDDEHRCTQSNCDHTNGCEEKYLEQQEPGVSSQSQSNQKQDNCEIILHLENKDRINNEGQGTDRTTQKEVGVVANVRRKKTEVPAIEGQSTEDPADNGKVKKKGNTQYEEPSSTRSEAVNEELVEMDEEEKKNTDSSRWLDRPRGVGCIEWWSKNSKAWFYTFQDESVWGSNVEGIEKLFDKIRKWTDTEGKRSSGSGTKGAKGSTARAIANQPIENRRAENAEVEKPSGGARKTQEENEVVEGPFGSEEVRSLARTLRERCDEILLEDGTGKDPHGATNTKEKVTRAQSRSPEKSRDKTKGMRAQSRSPEKSRDKMRRATSDMRGGSHERRRKERSRSKSPELKHRARHKEKQPVAEEVRAKSVSIGRQQVTWDNPHNPRQRTETAGGATLAERISQCERCSTYKGGKTQNTHEGTCHAARLICRHCQKQGHLALACWDKYQMEKEDRAVGSRACFFCDTTRHE